MDLIDSAVKKRSPLITRARGCKQPRVRFVIIEKMMTWAAVKISENRSAPVDRRLETLAYYSVAPMLEGILE